MIVALLFTAMVTLSQGCSMPMGYRSKSMAERLTESKTTLYVKVKGITSVSLSPPRISAQARMDYVQLEVKCVLKNANQLNISSTITVGQEMPFEGGRCINNMQGIAKDLELIFMVMPQKPNPSYNNATWDFNSINVQSAFFNATNTNLKEVANLCGYETNTGSQCQAVTQLRSGSCKPTTGAAVVSYGSTLVTTVLVMITVHLSR